MDGDVGGGRYTRDKQYTEEELIEITPEDIGQWMCLKAFRAEIPAPGGDRPVFARSTSLAFYKKAISFYVLNINLNWNTPRKEGYPTKSAPVNRQSEKARSAKSRRGISRSSFDVEKGVHAVA